MATFVRKFVAKLFQKVPNLVPLLGSMSIGYPHNSHKGRSVDFKNSVKLDRQLWSANFFWRDGGEELFEAKTNNSWTDFFFRPMGGLKSGKGMMRNSRVKSMFNFRVSSWLILRQQLALFNPFLLIENVYPWMGIKPWSRFHKQSSE